jgi:hypothetical protein
MLLKPLCKLDSHICMSVVTREVVRSVLLSCSIRGLAATSMSESWVNKVKVILNREWKSYQMCFGALLLYNNLFHSCSDSLHHSDTLPRR